jgi:hypothetical protein
MRHRHECDIISMPRDTREKHGGGQVKDQIRSFGCCHQNETAIATGAVTALKKVNSFEK